MCGLGPPRCLHRATDPVPDLTCPGLQQLQPCHRATRGPAPWAGPRPTLRQQQGHRPGPLLVLEPRGLPQVVLVNLTVYETAGAQ